MSTGVRHKDIKEPYREDDIGYIPPPDRSLDPDHDTAMKPLGEQKPRNRFLAFVLSRRLWFVILLALVILAAIEIPWYMWYKSPELDLKVAVLDKTAPFEDRREHRGLYWMLTQNKFVDLTQPSEERWYTFEKDYIGYQPIDPPEKWNVSTMLQRKLEDRQLVYIADTYGVYVADYTQFHGEDTAATIRSPKIFGGISPDEVDALEWFTGQGRTVIAEFNTFASPTADSERERMEELLGVTWTRWIGRFFLDFTDERDVPQWILERYAALYGHDWDLTGSGYVLCKDGSDEMIVLHTGEDVQPRGLEFIPRQQYMDEDVLQGAKPSTFIYWFDVLAPHNDTEVLADFKFQLTRQGRYKLEEHGLPDTFPAVTRVERNYRAYYLAGDMVDFDKAMGPPNTRLTLHINRNFHGQPVAGSAGYFFWHTFYPMITNIMRSESYRLTNRPEDIYLFSN